MSPEINNSAITKSGYKNHIQSGVSYGMYKEQMSDDLLLNTDQKVKEYIKLNQHRMQRVEKTYAISPILAEQVKELRHKAYWLVLTEHWCGDASQTLPVFNKIAKMSEGKVVLRMVYRDQNVDLMNAYLTNGTRSIPKLIQLDEQFNVTGIWGPRPDVAQQLVKQLKSDPETAGTYANDLHLWYARDKQKSLEGDILKLLLHANLYCNDCLS